MFSGSCVALATPFKGGAVDEKAFCDLIEFQVAARTSAIVPCGSTGESATLTHQEHGRLIEVAVRQARGRIPVIAGAGSNSTSETVSLVRHARAAGADAALLIVPYYNKPTQNGLFEHFSAAAKNAGLPIILYNIPGRTGTNMLPQTVARIARSHKNVVGIKESSGNLEQITEVAALTAGRKDFVLLSGDDSLTLPILAVGGKGVISVLANVDPKGVSELCRRFQAGDMKKAQALNLKMLPLVKALFIETNPAPVKAAMEFLGLCSSELRLPLCPLLPESRRKLLLEMKRYGLKP